jgi:hypothetical protein
MERRGSWFIVVGSWFMVLGREVIGKLGDIPITPLQEP